MCAFQIFANYGNCFGQFADSKFICNQNCRRLVGFNTYCFHSVWIRFAADVLFVFVVGRSRWQKNFSHSLDYMLFGKLRMQGPMVLLAALYSNYVLVLDNDLFCQVAHLFWRSESSQEQVAEMSIAQAVASGCRKYISPITPSCTSYVSWLSNQPFMKAPAEQAGIFLVNSVYSACSSRAFVSSVRNDVVSSPLLSSHIILVIYCQVVQDVCLEVLAVASVWVCIAGGLITNTDWCLLSQVCACGVLLQDSSQGVCKSKLSSISIPQFKFDFKFNTSVPYARLFYSEGAFELLFYTPPSWSCSCAFAKQELLSIFESKLHPFSHQVWEVASSHFFSSFSTFHSLSNFIVNDIIEMESTSNTLLVELSCLFSLSEIKLPNAFIVWPF